MKLTTEHSASSYGMPVFVDDDNQLVDYADGLRQTRKAKGWSVADLANEVGVSPRTVEGWEQGRMPSKPALIILSKLL
jgi:ribosome-binding protein aMBF1 (putative translation factor)